MNDNHPEESIKHFAEQWRRARPDLTAGSFVTIGLLLALAQRLDQEFRTYTQSNFQMGTGDMRILLALRRANDSLALRPADLFRALLITSGAVAKQLERLTQRGFVERIPDPQRKGGWQIRLTPAGKHVADTTLTAIHNDFKISTGFEKLGEKEREAGILFLQKLIAEYGGSGPFDLAAAAGP